MARRKHIDHEIGPEFEQVTENIYVGTSMCCREHVDYHFAKLQELGITVDIDLRAEDHDSPSEELVDRLDAHLWLPINDTFPPSMWQAHAGVDLIKQTVAADKKVYVHCEYGHGRSPTLVALFFIREQNMTAVEAVEFVKEKRSVFHPTEMQLKFLQEFENAVKVKSN